MKVRALSLSCINNVGYKLHPYPLVHLSKLLMMKVWSSLLETCQIISWLVFSIYLLILKTECTSRNQIWNDFAMLAALRPAQMKWEISC